MRIVLALLSHGLSRRRALPLQAQLARLKVDPGRIKSIYLAPVGYAQDAPVQSYTGWVAFTDCRGNLVIDLTQTNAVRSIYTTGACTVPGVD